VYEIEEERPEGGQRIASGEGSRPKLATWLGDIRSYFTRDLVAVIQQDAIERKGLKELLFEPETLSQVTPSVELCATLITMKNLIPDATKETARVVVRAVVEEIQKRLRGAVEQAVRGALDRSRHSPVRSLPNLDWRRTIERNLRNYVPARRTLIPDRIFFWARQQRRREWSVIVCMDQSGSMSESCVYGSVMGAVLASIPALETHVVAYDTEVVDLTDRCADPVDLLFGGMLGGGNDGPRALTYCRGLIREPRKAVFVLISDLFEPDEGAMTRMMGEMVESGVRAVTLLALSDSGVPSYNEPLAKRLAAVGVPCFACTPNLLPDLLAGALRGENLGTVAARVATKER
jgi:hypothetical protein